MDATFEPANSGHNTSGHRTPVNSPRKPRSLSDNAASLEPSPILRENRNLATTSKDDHALTPLSPRTPRRPELSRGLSLQMPDKTQSSPLSVTANGAPLSPQLDPSNSYGSPATSLPRHSRGLDFSRACTNLHHSTLAESSPDSSPIIHHKSMPIPCRKGSVGSMMLDSPNLGPVNGWPPLGNNERSTVSSSLGSVNMMASPSDSSESEDDDLMDDNDDTMFTTPQVHKISNFSAQTPYASQTVQSPTGTWSNNFSPAAASLMKNFQRTRMRRGRSRKSSSSASGQSAVPSPRTTSPPPLRSIESASGYFGWAKMSSTRRESLALGTDNLHLSSGNDSGDEGPNPTPATPGVVRRAVTRRGNLLPKTKGFARIRAALMEESAPLDTDVRREAETIKQVRERDGSVSGALSPSLLPVVPESENALEDIPEDSTMGLDDSVSRKLMPSFSQHASRNSNGAEYWNRFNKDFRTPPPPSFPTRASSSLGGDISMDSPVDSNTRSESAASTQEPPVEDVLPATASVAPPKKFGKRARDDDFDIASIKRRAVSPSMSVHNSPVVAQSPRDREPSTWGGPPKTTRENSAVTNPELPSHRSNSGGSSSSLASAVAALGPKRVGLQSMTDTNDGLMKMSIE